MRLKEMAATDFDLACTLDSGQVFHWEKCGDGFTGTIGAKAVYVAQRRKRLFFSGVTTKIIRHYFALDHPLAEICRSFPNDPAICAARDFCEGLRIIRQPHWECLATFITSSMKQVAHIRQISQTLRKRYGKRQRVFDFEVHTFPPASRIAGLTEDESLRAHLCELPGVGAKVANCVMLFAYERLRAFPIDVWIERVLKQRYFPRKGKVTATQLHAFCGTYFGEHGGYAQQYLFHHARKGGAVPRLAAK
jgi:N-glycosylase/DNA lyase